MVSDRVWYSNDEHRNSLSTKYHAQITQRSRSSCIGARSGGSASVFNVGSRTWLPAVLVSTFQRDGDAFSAAGWRVVPLYTFILGPVFRELKFSISFSYRSMAMTKKKMKIRRYKKWIKSQLQKNEERDLTSRGLSPGNRRRGGFVWGAALGETMVTFTQYWSRTPLLWQNLRASAGRLQGAVQRRKRLFSLTVEDVTRI